MDFYNYFLQKVLSISSLLLIRNFSTLPIYSKIKTQEDSDKFLKEYCFEIVNAIKDAYESQIIAIEGKDFQKFGEQGLWIGGLSEIYSKLCKKN